MSTSRAGVSQPPTRSAIRDGLSASSTDTAKKTSTWTASAERPVGRPRSARTGRVASSYETVATRGTA